MTNELRWQVPGNANPFDSKLEDWKNEKSIVSQRSIGVLEFIEKCRNNISKYSFEEEIKSYLQYKFHHKINESCTAHFYRPLEFIGLIRNINNQLSVSIDGKNFLRAVKNQEYDKATDFYILQLLKAKYPNSATKNIHLNLFPFRIIFKLLLSQDLPLEYFTNKIPYIKSMEDIRNLININGQHYDKWKAWTLSYLIKWKILEKTNSNIIKLSPYKFDFIKSIVSDMEYEDMFFNDGEQIFFQNKIRSKIKRNSQIIQDVIQEYGCKCFFCKDHISFPSNKLINYVEGHHIIPISLKDSFKENLDCKDNLIPLCPNCHKAIHLSKNEYKDTLLKEIISRNYQFRNKYNVNIDDLREIYFM